MAAALLDERKIDRISSLLKGSVADRQRRFGYYRTGYRDKVLQNVQFSFEAVLSLLDSDERVELLSEFCRTVPSRSYSVFDSGLDFVDFISRHRLNRKYKFIAELARFEWQIMLVFSLPRRAGRVKKCKENLKLVSSFWPLLEVWRNRSSEKSTRAIGVKKLTTKAYFLIAAAPQGARVREVSKREYLEIRGSINR